MSVLREVIKDCPNKGRGVLSLLRKQNRVIQCLYTQTDRYAPRQSNREGQLTLPYYLVSTKTLHFCSQAPTSHCHCEREARGNLPAQKIRIRRKASIDVTSHSGDCHVALLLAMTWSGDSWEQKCKLLTETRYYTYLSTKVFRLS